ncbi:ABC transporter ATP-binding protein [Aurantiacibacter marinus]|uniref:Ferrichrome ABC transporter ATP-binding protein n=1 Tax=Aurantiacibacter marinus TaxID=874156 RepID=A0A0H0XNH0_9SPHN|nr:ABC transporter ATP-binding protein [Aurantiacibacter marinus]KLI63576.1 ferrichrome ABC transporter ATP-binding protein [Aurantiacibacter marinus]
MILACKNLSVRRAGKRVLGDVSCEFLPGDITAICGPNGAGKSTLLSALGNLIAPDTGEVTLSDKPLPAMHPLTRARNIGYLPQSAEIAWDVSVANLVALGRLPHRDEGKAEINQAIVACALDAFRERPVSTLSGGEKARALLARVLAGTPQWVLADEPLAALDIAHQLSLLAVLKGEAESGCGVVLVLHDLALAMNHADRVLVLHEGNLVADGAPEDALSPENIAQAWGVKARWLGEPGQRALITDF